MAWGGAGSRLGGQGWMLGFRALCGHFLLGLWWGLHFTSADLREDKRNRVRMEPPSLLVQDPGVCCP